ncbi:uncharacterized protein LOC127010629 [Drosophila biarmipes]|uniref:uncharacterized protein LOC127010629 n=1 Tax=Drosophila biarmipes TaxID=125945 RepID=UPI0021CCF07F|nr:uncharacterized protein LOC127010629 [Drosophila biarmipes]
MYKIEIAIFFAFIACNLYSTARSQDYAYWPTRPQPIPQTLIPQAGNLHGSLLETLLLIQILEKLNKIEESCRPSVKFAQQDEPCVLTDAPNQCGAFCLAAQRPFIDSNQDFQKRLQTLAEKLNERLGRIEEGNAELKNLVQIQKKTLKNLQKIQKEMLATLGSKEKGKVTKLETDDDDYEYFED